MTTMDDADAAAAKAVPFVNRDARRRILEAAAPFIVSAAAPVIAAAERERILRLARELGAVIPADEGSQARWASFADYLETTEGTR